jgi:flagellar protein FliO/FliZ
MTFLTDHSTLIFALTFAGVAALAVWFITYQVSASGYPMFGARERRLGLVQSAMIGGGRRLILIRRDDVEHLIMTGGPVDAVIETGIRREQPLPDGHLAEAAQGTGRREIDPDGNRMEPAMTPAQILGAGDDAPSSRFGGPLHLETAGSPIGAVGSLFRKLRHAATGEEDGHSEPAPSRTAIPKHLTMPILKGEEQETRQDVHEAVEPGETKGEKI